ncbi:unnamed protein product [Linum tenue]|uniref:(S)-N-methylcoclaurine 3'-hydroxylase isozyme 2 n=1 Tax=Linum tenue TaxID=586396 RepID=A0AAV0J469_9ROSI|nr:unnamed protein product [Linum tenue]
MEHSVSVNETLLLLLLPLLLLLLSIKHVNSKKKEELPLPPGPKPWPILGNIPHMTRKVHITMSEFAKSHGPLISVKLGAQLIVVASSPAAAAEILKTHDRVLSARYASKANPFKLSDVNRMAIVWATTCNDSWKSLRALCRTELFSGRAIESQAAVRERKVREMVEFLAAREGRVVDIGEIVFTTVFNSLCNLFFSDDLLVLEDRKGKASGLKSHISKMMELAATLNIADFFPVLARLDPQGLKKKVAKVVSQMFSVWERYIKERRETHESEFHVDALKRDFLDVFLSNGFDDHKINWLFFELLTAGTDTITTTVEWAMAELLRNGEAMRKVREELKREIGENSVNEANASQLTFLNACIKETFRLHPPVPFLIPHCAMETCEVMNYRIPKDSQVLVNVWAIGRDPSVWEDPLSFRPERFLDKRSAVADFKGCDFELLPFGSGRRACPGLPMATKQLSLILASLIEGFDWTLPDGDDPAKLDMEEKFGLTLQKDQPLLLIARKHSM